MTCTISLLNQQLGAVVRHLGGTKLDYRFDSFNPRSFEQLIQGLCVQILSPGITPFGDGRDGGREATFEGAVNYQTDGSPWDGYGVIQAKFLQRPLGTDKDGPWAITQLRSELAEYEKSDSERRLPEYYIFATNATLSAVQDVGTKDLAFAELRAFAERHGLKGFDVWDYDKLRILLDGQPELRSTYVAWLTPGDVISAALSQLQGFEVDFDRLMIKLLQRELVDNQFARLEQAGDSADARVPLASVFVDIPFARAHSSMDTDVEPDGLVVAEIYENAQLKLDPATLAAGGVRTAKDRFVLIGGPGQGKTTVAQFMCQLFRASLVRDVPRERLTHEVRMALRAFEQQLADQGPEVAGVRRFPVHIVLNELAHFLAHAAEDEFSVEAFLARRMTKRLGAPVQVRDLRRWLVSYPTFVVFDGLDEVPASTNRGDVKQVLSDFLLDSQTDNADMLVVATSRPQGYSAEFNRDRFRHFFLTSLSEGDALRYGRKLVHVKHGEGSERALAIESRLLRAISEESVSHLMRSPLQVTIMALLVDKVGQPPKERYTLFSEYYNVIYSRELERDIPAAAILRDYRSDIDSIHWRLGLTLQVRSEVEGGTDSRLNRNEFSDLVRGRLQEEEHEGSSLEELVTQITEAAAERLVFIVGHETDAIGFEIRSLQEFMAAEALHEGNESDVQQRLRAIAPVVHWRNVFLFAAGRCFTKSQSLRDTIVAICNEMNSALSYGEVSDYLRRGSDLAVEILVDGSCRFQPKYIRSLLGVAANVIASPGANSHSELAAAASELRQGSVLLDEIERRELFPKGGTLRIALLLAEGGDERAQGQIDALLGDPRMTSMVLRAALSAEAFTFLKPRLERLVACTQPGRILSFRGTSARRDALLDGLPEWVESGMRQMTASSGVTTRAQRILFRLADSSRTPISLAYWSVNKKYNLYAGWQDIPESYAVWRPINAAAGFVRDPSVSTLLHVLEVSVGAQQSVIDQIVKFAPWPLAALLAENSSRFDAIAQDLRNGEYGDLRIWLAAENRWRRDGISTADVEHCLQRTGDRPFGRDIESVGFPLVLRQAFGLGSLDREGQDAALKELLPVVPRVAPSRPRGILRTMVLQMIENVANRARISQLDSRSWIAMLPDSPTEGDVARGLDTLDLQTMQLLAMALPETSRDAVYSRWRSRGGYLRTSRHRPDAILELARDVVEGFARSGGSIGHIALLVAIGRQMDIRGMIEKARIEPRGLAGNDGDSGSIALFEVLSKGPEAALDEGRTAIMQAKSPYEFAMVVDDILARQGISGDKRERVMYELARHADELSGGHPDIAILLRDIVRIRRSGLEDAATCVELGIPEIVSQLSYEVPDRTATVLD
ncbi:hypothetical protein E0H73_01740 [Kribbella pittospori]|uniref:NACHT domain-containing protein n=1 Tax=Kribbella pittospori TaxID=722689 RepID=A0A4R0L9U5_9ACTN|nr:hypothetical protein [Kribbella pittospori]TCC65685.1 hypothetical protein E0H73_01740 [Kribbella pittospori]